MHSRDRIFRDRNGFPKILIALECTHYIYPVTRTVLIRFSAKAFVEESLPRDILTDDQFTDVKKRALADEGLKDQPPGIEADMFAGESQPVSPSSYSSHYTAHHFPLIIPSYPKCMKE